MCEDLVHAGPTGHSVSKVLQNPGAEELSSILTAQYSESRTGTPEPFKMIKNNSETPKFVFT